MNRQTSVKQEGPTDFILRMPFYDNEGDPIDLSVTTEGHHATVDDAGRIAGILFSLDEHTDDGPGYQLLQKLAQAHGLERNCDNGLVKLNAWQDRLCDIVAEMTKVVITMQTALPHIRRTSTGSHHPDYSQR